jgi:plastocyanin
MRRMLALVSLVALLGVLMAGATAAASTRTVRVTGTEQFIVNAKIMATLRFEPGPLAVSSGDTVRWVNETDEPHTISVVAKADLPTTIDDVFACGVCNTIFGAHFPGGPNNPPIAVVNVGSAGLDAVGDSLWQNPGETVSAVISAPAGSTLHYLCAIHAWMQGTIKVH